MSDAAAAGPAGPLTGLTVRWMYRRDVPAVLDLERIVHRGWDESEFRAVILCRPAGRKTVGAMVAEAGGGVVGHVVYEVGPDRVHLLGLAVRPDARRRGVGRRLVRHMTDRLNPSARTVLQADVPEGALDVQLFLRRLGFRAARVLRGWYEDPAEDAYLMECRWQEAGRGPARAAGGDD